MLLLTLFAVTAPNWFAPVLIAVVMGPIFIYWYFSNRKFQADYDREQIEAGRWPRDLSLDGTSGPSSYNGIKHWWNPFDTGYNNVFGNKLEKPWD